ncbi:MAG: metallophosphoesterase [Saprospiraceae bacterium]
MKKRILRYFKHLLLTILAVIIIGFGIIVSLGGAVHYGDNPLMRNLDGEGPYLFYQNDSTLTVNYIRGNKDDGFTVKQQDYSTDSTIALTCNFPLDSSSFSFKLNTNISTPPVIYQDEQSIVALSDIESGFKTFRDFLIRQRVIDEQLNWIFGKGHLVLVGDLVDRGYSTTQVLWLIYKLEQAAQVQGGMVHLIIGNHELKNMQGKYESASPKYYGVAAILGRQPHELYAPHSFLGKWLASKNTVERINGVLFAHGGLHPDIANMELSLNEINQLIRKNYYYPYYPKPQETDEQLLNSNRTGVAWYRGYFKEDLEQEQIDAVLNKFSTTAIVVGHTIQSKVNRQFDGKVIAIDVRHPNDYHQNFPHRDSEGLLIENGGYYRLLHKGERIEL